MTIRSAKQSLPLVALWVVAAVGVTYAGDYVVLRYRIWKQQNPFAQVMVTEYLAIPLKDGRTQYEFQQPHAQDCVNTLYPHMKTQPCWYLRRHREKRINVLR